MARERREIVVQGIVQGVGFRPFIYALAQRHGLAGWVRNDAMGVAIEIEGDTAKLDDFLHNLKSEAPPLAVVESVVWQPGAVRHEREFHIEASRAGEQRHALISPDAAVCANCLRELFDPADRRYRYPFLNCANCGPRFTITRAVPYDRAMTTMAGFTMCGVCRQEYEDPADRRFHAQPTACPVCGPQARLCDATGREMSGEAGEEDAIRHAARLLREGAIVAVKGLGGYHLACDPFHPTAARTLRERKARQDKPFALMALNMEQARILCHIGPEEETLLTSPARPIVLLERRADAGIAETTAPRQTTLGVMLAYTPLHHLLLHDAETPLVMTSGNRADEPIAYRDEEAFAQLADIADCFLTHNRPIHARCDDSIARVLGVRCWVLGVEGEAITSKPNCEIPTSDAHHPTPNTQHPTPNTQHRASACRQTPCLLRRSRGYAPAPLKVVTRFERHILACGGELKNTFCVAKENHAFLSHHIGDLENYETLRSFREGIDHFRHLFDVRPELVACDLHPGYLSTQYARELEEAGLPLIGIQHHHAHIAACLADNERPDEEIVIGVALDGTGYGGDGTIWGGEFLTGSIAKGFARRAHLERLPLPGGEASIRQPWRNALAQLIRLYGEEATLRLPLAVAQESGECNVRLIARLLERRLNTPLTSSAGRLFDAVAALIGVPGSRKVTYEGQAAIELELAACGVETCGPGYPFRLSNDGVNGIIETDGILRGVAEDVLAAKPAGEIAARFHRTMAEMVLAGCLQIQKDEGGRRKDENFHTKPLSPIQGRKAVLPDAPVAAVGESWAVALSGGTFQNALLLELVQKLLTQQGFTVYQHQRVPTNDGGLCLGQAALANSHLRNGNG